VNEEKEYDFKIICKCGHEHLVIDGESSPPVWQTSYDGELTIECKECEHSVEYY
jgi:hypothetical protein